MKSRPHPTAHRWFATRTWVVMLLVASFDHSVFGQQELNRDYELPSAVLQLVSTVEMPATADGPLSQVLVQEGALVTANQVLATINDDEAGVKLEEALIELAIVKQQAQSDVDIKFALKSKQVALADYRRAQQSNRGYAGVVSDREMDRLKLLVEKSDAELERIRFEKSVMSKQVKLREAAAKKARFEVERHKIRAAIAGQVVEMNKREGEWVNVADPVLKLVQLDRLKVEGFLPASIANADLVGAAATFTSAETNSRAHSASGMVVFVSPNIDPLNSKVNVRVEFENPKLMLRPGMKGQVVIHCKRGTSESAAGNSEDRKSHSDLNKDADE